MLPKTLVMDQKILKNRRSVERLTSILVRPVHQRYEIQHQPQSIESRIVEEKLLEYFYLVFL